MSASFFAAVSAAFGKYDVVHIHAEGPAFFAWLPKMFGKRAVVTVHGTCEIIWVTRKNLISCGFARLDLFYLNLFLCAMVRCVPARFQGLMASGCALYLTHHSES